MTSKKVSFNLDEDIHFKIKEVSFLKHKTLSDMYRKYIYEGLRRDLEEMDESKFRKDEMVQKKLNDYEF